MNSYLSIDAFNNVNDEPILLSKNVITDIRKIESLIIEIVDCFVIILSKKDKLQSDKLQKFSQNIYYNDSIEKSTLDYPESIIEENIFDSTYLPRFKCISCQIENDMVTKNRCRYNIISQVCQCIKYFYVIG